MRIISGMARGRKLFTPGQSKSIRPTTDRAREALFSIIGTRVIAARVLDLYAGTGALGLEALSRGARQVVFVDKHHKALELIKKNCALCVQNMAPEQTTRAVIIKHDLRRSLNLIFPESPDEKVFDLVFLDPPYEQGLAQASLEALDTSQFLTSTSLVIAEECSGEKLPDSFTRLILSDQRRYGDTGLWFYTVKMES
ncbi:MAG: 16S rRNA (guanine(966)-N(2))-methyltransferase RsmD [Thermodesulfobacteriota bacterium]|nr:16S rRNA (guanine(966)-N(2))-methyltransferase RsmD [Thermodesulfobacteriota bacterium]